MCTACAVCVVCMRVSSVGVRCAVCNVLGMQCAVCCVQCVMCVVYSVLCVVCRVPCMRHEHVPALPTFQVAAPAAVCVFRHRLLLSPSSSLPHKILPQTHTYTHVSHMVCGLHFLSSLSSFPICLLGAPKSCGLQREKQRQKPRQRWNNQGKGHRWGLAWGGEGTWRWSSVHLSVICPTLSLPSPLLPGVFPCRAQTCATFLRG